MPAVVAAAAGKGGVAASALMCAASFIRALHLQCIPFLGDPMFMLLACIQHDPASARRAGSSSSGSDSSGDDDLAPANARASKAEASKGDYIIMEAARADIDRIVHPCRARNVCRGRRALSRRRLGRQLPRPGYTRLIALVPPPITCRAINLSYLCPAAVPFAPARLPRAVALLTARSVNTFARIACTTHLHCMQAS